MGFFKKLFNFAGCIRFLTQNKMKGIAFTGNAGRSAYESPVCIVMEMFSEGVLCQSDGKFTGGYHEGVDGDDSPII